MVNILHPEVREVEIFCGKGFVGNPIDRRVERTHHVGPNRVRVTQDKGMDSALKSRPAEGQNVHSVIVVQIMRIRIQITAEQRMFLAHLVIDSAHTGVLVIRYLSVKPDLTALVLSSGKTPSQV